MPWRRAARPVEAPDPAELARAARVLELRSRRAASASLAGAWTSAFRGGGLEFEELRPYVPGDEVRAIDWNATARTGAPIVRRFREERDQTLVLLLDVSASMRFGTSGRSKALQAAHAAALLAATTGHARDRLGLVAFDTEVRCEILPQRGPAQALRVVRAALASAGDAGGGTGLAAALERVPRQAGRHAVVCLLSDFRDGAGDGDGAGERARNGLAGLAARHDVVSIVLHDPREEALPAVGPVRFADPERPDRTLWLDAGLPAVRARYRAACAARRRALERRLRGLGSDVLWLRTDEAPLGALVRFLHQRSGRRRLAG